MKKEDIEQRIKVLTTEQQRLNQVIIQCQANLNAHNGALNECQIFLQMLIEEENIEEERKRLETERNKSMGLPDDDECA